MSQKKYIVFLADNSLILLNLYYKLKNNYEIIWIIYHKGVYQKLKKKKIKNVYLINLSLKFLQKKSIINKSFKYIIYGLLKIELEHHDLKKKIKEIEIKYNPLFWITDTGKLLSNIKTKASKGTTFHSVCYKKYYLIEKYLTNYDYIFLPGFYHKKRIELFLPKIAEKNSLKVIGNVKLANFVKNKKIKIYEKKKLYKKIKLDLKRKTILLALTHDAFPDRNFFPKSFGNQFEKLEMLSEKINNLGYNFVIKFHHFSYFYHKNKTIKKIAKKNFNHVFGSSQIYDVIESENIYRIADIIITDTSGVGTTGIYLNKKMIFIEPELAYDRNHVDTSLDLRPGYICNKFEEIIQSIKKYKNNDPFVYKKKAFVNKVFYQPNKNAIDNLSRNIIRITEFEK